MLCCYVVTLSELPLIISNILCLQKYFILYLIYFTFYVILKVTLAGPAIMPFYVNRFKSEIRFLGKKSGIYFLGHIAQRVQFLFIIIFKFFN